MNRDVEIALVGGLGVALVVALAGCDSKTRGDDQSPAEADREPRSRGGGHPPDAGPKPKDTRVVARTADVSPVRRYLPNLDGSDPLVATIGTSEGTVHCRLFENDAPVTVGNFAGLATGRHPWRDPRDGTLQRKTPFYDGLAFYRTIPGFLVQSGAPTQTLDDTPGYTIPDERNPRLDHDHPGMLGMAQHGPGTAGSQFYITLRPARHLDGHHTVFGRCLNLEVVRRIAERSTDADAGAEAPPRIESISFERRPISFSSDSGATGDVGTRRSKTTASSDAGS